MNKQKIWFLTLFSLILILSVYYITMPKELLLTNLDKYKKWGIGDILPFLGIGIITNSCFFHHFYFYFIIILIK